ncbi:MAG: aminotransferase class I/II-fold pyridoxal phosphate-dependent enzyme, partial [Salinivirgaceae bacterium]|nr:aminotransferase class I/II-fold pyridoxal phosphate-dependent enzyme [Salinivirgaceae bacterium]
TPLASISNEIAEQTLTVMSHSKTFNVAGLTTSYVICPNSEMLKKYNRGLNVPHLHMGNIFGTEALIAAYTEGEPWLEQLLVYLQKNIETVDAFLKAEIPQIKMMKPESTYLLWLDCKELKMEPKELHQFFLSEAKVAINEGSMFGPGGEGFVRMNVGCPQSMVKQGLQQIKDALKWRKTAL